MSFRHTFTVFRPSAMRWLAAHGIWPGDRAAGVWMCVLIAVLAGAQMLFGMPTGSSYDAAGPDGLLPTYVWEHGQDGRRLSWRHQFGKDTVLYAQGSGMPVEHRLSDGLVRKITYDHRGNRKRVLTFVENDTAARHWIREEKMEFDLRDGLRGYTKITKSPDGSMDTVVRHYVLDERGWRIAELDGDSTVLKKWVYRGNYVAADSGTTDGPSEATGWKYYNGLGEQSQGVAFVGENGKLSGRWYLTDHLGSVTAVEDSAGERTLSLSLDPWGNLEVAKGSEGVGYGYTGKQLDALLGCSDHGARCLDNRMGMWWGRDRAKQWWNPYIRSNSPEQMIDSDGEKDLRVAIYYNYEFNEEIQETVPYDVKATAAEMQTILSDNLPMDEVSVEMFGVGELNKMKDFLNGGDAGVVIGHSDVGLPFLSDSPSPDSDRYIAFDELNSGLNLTIGVSACGAQVTIARGNYSHLDIVQGTNTRESEVFYRGQQYIESVSDTRNGVK